MGRHFLDLMTLTLATVVPRHRLNEGWRRLCGGNSVERQSTARLEPFLSSPAMAAQHSKAFYCTE
jgi:hypothetical protein